MGDGKDDDALDFLICDVISCWLSQLGASSFPLPITSSLLFFVHAGSPPFTTHPWPSTSVI